MIGSLSCHETKLINIKYSYWYCQLLILGGSITTIVIK